MLYSNLLEGTDEAEQVHHSCTFCQEAGSVKEVNIACALDHSILTNKNFNKRYCNLSTSMPTY